MATTRRGQGRRLFTKHNAAFEAYYRDVLVAEDEWEPFLASCRACLPSNFSFLQCPAGAASILASCVRMLAERQDECGAGGAGGLPGFAIATGCPGLLTF